MTRLSVLVPLVALVSVQPGRAQEPAPAPQPQSPSVTGRVTSALNGAPLSRVRVRIKSTNQGTTSDTDGRYTLNVPSLQDTLLFSALGYTPQEVPLDGRAEIDVQLAALAVEVAAVVVTGYRVQDRRTVTAAVSSVSSQAFADQPADNLSNALAGRLAGATVIQNAGTPGRESSIRIRAVGTLNNADPLYVIDGIVSDKFTFDGLSSEEVDNISILKDGAAASLYGSRAANGVVLVTTKRGGVGAAEFRYTNNVGIQEPTRIPPSLNALQQAEAVNWALRYSNIPTTDARYYTQDELEYYGTHSWDWIKELWRDPLDAQHSLTITGGTDGVKYFLSGSLLNATGSFDNLSFKRATTRANLDVDLTPRLKASVDFSNAGRNRDGPNWAINDWGQEDLYKALALRTRMIPPYVAGQPVGNWVEWHPGQVIADSAGYNRMNWSDYNATLRLTYQVPFVNGLSANLAYHKGFVESYQKRFGTPYNMALFSTTGTHNHILGSQVVGTKQRNDGEFLYNNNGRGNYYQLNGQVNFVRSFGDHHVDAFLVYEQAESDTGWFSGQRTDFISPVIDQFIGGSPVGAQADGRQRQDARISYVGSVGYDYARKYFVQTSFRYDGSVIFAPEYRWGLFPSISAGWRLTEEPFFRDKIPFFNELKLRGSVGVVGNDAVGRFQWLPKYTIDNGAVFDSITVGLTPGTLANRAITWEKSRSYNVGMDSRFWDNRMSLTLDVFFRNTYDILGSREEAIPSTFGAGLPDENYAKINSHGFEIELGYDGSAGDAANSLKYSVHGNVGYATNKIVQLDEAANLPAWQRRLGRTTAPASACLGYVYTGMLRTQADIDALPPGYTILGVPPQLGMLNYKDIRGTGGQDSLPDGKITSDDRAWFCKYNSPPISYGISLGASWRGLRFAALLQGAAGSKHLMQTNGRDIQARAEESSYGYWADSWTPENPDGAYPGYRIPFTGGSNYRTRFPESTFWLRDASFLRLKNVTVSYVLPARITNALGVSGATLHFTGTNLLILKDHFGDWGFDPEMNNIRAYPLMRTFAVGVDVSLRRRVQ
jgi:TonB-linked SusC/RagA family outer membrane protein